MSTAVVVTGASRGIGAATARWLARAGAGVTLVARSAEDLRATAHAVEDAGGRAVVLALDLAAPGAADEVVAETLQRFGRLDAVVNNAALLAPIARVGAADPRQWERTIEVDLLVPFRLVRTALPALRQSGGRVVNLLSTAAHLPIAGLSAYAAAKAGLSMLTRVLALEEPSVTAVAVQPGPADTDMHVALRAGDALDEDRRELYRDLAREGRLRDPAVPGRAVAWLALAAPPGWSGREVEHDDDAVTRAAEALLGRI